MNCLHYTVILRRGYNKMDRKPKIIEYICYKCKKHFYLLLPINVNFICPYCKNPIKIGDLKNV